MDCCAEEPYLSEKIVKQLKVLLYVVFFINAGMFLTEVIGGIVAHSNALVADSFDMFGDAFVYGLSLFVLSKHHGIQAKASLVKGVVMLLFGLYVFWEAFHKITLPVLPSAQTVTSIGLLALTANTICFFLLTKHKDKNLNLKSAWICSRNDIYSNISVILAGVLVHYFNSVWPDIIVGAGIAGLISYFSIRIVNESLRHIA